MTYLHNLIFAVVKVIVVLQIEWLTEYLFTITKSFNEMIAQQLTLLLVLLLSSSGFCQDVLVLKNGDEIPSRVIEVSRTAIKYKKFTNLDGPDYVLPINELFMIKYENGEKDVFPDAEREKSKQFLLIENGDIGNEYYMGGRKLTKEELTKELATDPIAYNQYNQGKTQVTTGIFTGVIGTIGIAAAASTWLINGSPNVAFLAVGGTLCIGGAVLTNIGRGKVTKAINTYNTHRVSLEIGLNSTGIGLAYNF